MKGLAFASLSSLNLFCTILQHSGHINRSNKLSSISTLPFPPAKPRRRQRCSVYAMANPHLSLLVGAAREYVELSNSHALEACMERFLDQAEYTSSVVGTCHGKKAITDMMNGFFTKFPGVRPHPRRAVFPRANPF